MTNATEDLARALGRSFIERRDVKALQSHKGTYRPIEEKWTLQDLVDHIEGTTTWGHYLVAPGNTCRIFAFDIDLNETGWISIEPDEYQEISPRSVWLTAQSNDPIRLDLQMQLRCMAEGLAIRTKKLLPDVKVLVAYSGGKGMHVYGLLDAGTPAGDAREAGRLVLDSFTDTFELVAGKNFYRHKYAYSCLSIELFPKQDELREGGYGNLLRLPLGKNRKTGHDGFFVDLSRPINELRVDDPAVALAQGSLR